MTDRGVNRKRQTRKLLFVGSTDCERKQKNVF